MINRALKLAIDDLKAAKGDDISTWLTPVRLTFLWSQGALPTPIMHSMNRGTYNHIVEFRKPFPRAVNIIPPGQSGFLNYLGEYSHAYDQLPLYDTWTYKPVLFKYQNIKEVAESEMILIRDDVYTPVAVDDSETTDEDVPITIDVLANDYYLDSNNLIIVDLTDPIDGTVIDNGDGTITFLPDANFNGVTSFTYKVFDGIAESNTATVSVTVNSVNDVPVANDDTAIVDEDGFVDIDVLGNDNDVDADDLTITSVSSPSLGTVVIMLGTIEYTPFENLNGPDSFTYTISDDMGGTATATVYVTINAVNDAPIADDDLIITDEDVPVDIALSASDIDGDFLTYLIVDAPAHGVLSITGPNVFYTPDLNYYGPDSFTFKVSDGSLESNIATISITINAVNDAPVALDDSAITDQDISVLIDLLANDYDVDDISLTIISVFDKTSGGVVLNGDGTVTYYPVIDYVGTAQFKYTISDSQGATDTAICVVTMLDKTPPTTYIDIDGTSGNDDWFTSSVTITLTADDAHSVIFLTKYRINGGSWITYSEPFDISIEGINTIEYRSVDGNNNVEAIKEAEFKIDTTNPLSMLFVQQPHHKEGNVYYVTKTTQFILSAKDDEWPFSSGILEIEYQIDSGSWNTHQGDELTFIVTLKGPHTINFHSIDEAGNEEEVKSIQIEVNAYILTYLGEIGGAYSDPVTLQASFFDMALQQLIEGKTIRFDIGDQFNLAETDSNGVATCTLILTQPEVSTTVIASFAGDIDYEPVSVWAPFFIEKEEVYLTYTGFTVVPTTVGTIELRATILEDQDGYWGDLNKIFITFSIYSVPMGETPLQVFGSYMVEFTNVDGVGVIVIEIPNLNVGGYLIKVTLTPDENFYHQAGASDLAILTVYKPTGDFVTGGGWIVDSNGNKGNFGFNVKYKKNGLPKGQAIYVYREGDWEYIVKSNAWIGMAIIGNHSFFEAKCVVQQYNSKTGELYWGEGNYRMRVDVWDGEEDGNTDVYQIRVYDKNGIVYHEAGFDPYGHLMGGNIVIHIDKKK